MGSRGIVALVCPFKKASKGSGIDVSQCSSHLLLLFHVGIHQPVEGFGVLGDQGFVGIEGFLPHEEAEDLAAVDTGGKAIRQRWVLKSRDRASNLLSIVRHLAAVAAVASILRCDV